jgi:hypothetical protein
MKSLIPFLSLGLFSIGCVEAFHINTPSLATRVITRSTKNRSRVNVNVNVAKSPLQTPTKKALIRASTSLRGGAIPLPGILGSNPFAAAFVICAFKATAADLLAQAGERKGLEIKRTIAFLFYGGLYQGCFQEFMFNGIFPKLFGEGIGMNVVVKKVAFDMLVISPFLCLPVAYFIKAVVFGQTMKEGLNRYIHDIQHNKLLKKYWAIWAPVQCCTFTVVPPELRITFIAFVSFFWLILLSTVSARSMTVPKGAAPKAA